MHQHDIRNCRNSYRLMMLTSTGYFRHRQNDESMSADIVFLGINFASIKKKELFLRFYLINDTFLFFSFFFSLKALILINNSDCLELQSNIIPCSRNFAVSSAVSPCKSSLSIYFGMRGHKSTLLQLMQSRRN
ncbi:hypothetical protein PUN28_006052 [Cardiocondyla obscurior]|uniref:Uncharacterized protein n=1 Tax=Cardiocondyla obscurior TaxID=286306 RepID=A0AAW2G6Z2_9HYME